MPTYMCKAVTDKGQIVRTRVNEANKAACAKKLKRNNLIPISINATLRMREKQKKQPRNFRRVNQNDLKKIGIKNAKKKNESGQKTLIESISSNLMKINLKEIKIFTQNFYLLKKAKFNNVHALSTIMESTENPKLRSIIEDILYGVEAGEYMYTTMEYYSNVFPYIYINMIKVGELSGSLDLALGQAIKYLDDTDVLNKKLKRILIPNIGMFIGITVMLFVCVIVGVPIVQDIFASIGSSAKLPAITMWFADVVNKLIQYWYIPTFIMFAIIGGILFYINTPIGRYRFDNFKYRMPIFGKLIYLIDFSRLLKNMLLNIQNGIRIQDSLQVSKSVVKNTVMQSMIDNAINNTYIGESWIQPFEDAKFSNQMTVEMLKIGMQTDLSEMMEKLIEYMDIDIDNNLEKIMKILPELSYLLVGIVLIFFVLVVLVPCIQIYMGGFLFDAYGV